MSGTLLRRLAAMPLVVWGAATIVFIVLRVVPGDVVNELAGLNASPEQRVQIREDLGLDQPIWAQYLIYLGGLLRFDLGRSFFTGQPVGDLLKGAIPVTIELAIAATVVMVVVGISTGVLAAAMRGSWVDTLSRGLATVFFSMPWFWLGVLLIVLFSVQLKLLPSFGRLPPGTSYDPTTNFVLVDAVLQNRYDLIGPWLQHLILPALTIGLTTAGFVTRITRASFVETMDQDFVRTARSKGMSNRRLFWGHIFRNASLPIVTVIGLLFGGLLGGAVISEVVFSYPGIGKLLVDTIGRRDYPVVQGAALVITTLYILISILTDASYAILDPRLRR